MLEDFQKRGGARRTEPAVRTCMLAVARARVQANGNNVDNYSNRNNYYGSTVL